MVEINLLPQELRKKESRLKKMNFPPIDLDTKAIMRIVFAAAGILVIVHFSLFAYRMCDKRILASLEKRYSALGDKKKEADALKARDTMIHKKIGAIDELMVKRFEWSKKMNDLSDSMTPDVWLTQLSYDEKLTDRSVQKEAKVNDGKTKKELKTQNEKVLLRYLTLSGYAAAKGEEGTASIGKFIEALKENQAFYPDFSDIELGAIKRDKIDGQDVMNFTITCFFKEAKRQ